jgi:hypothetical protein
MTAGECGPRSKRCDASHAKILSEKVKLSLANDMIDKRSATKSKMILEEYEAAMKSEIKRIQSDHRKEKEKLQSQQFGIAARQVISIQAIFILLAAMIYYILIR